MRRRWRPHSPSVAVAVGERHHGRSRRGCDNSGQSQAGQATCNFTAHTGPPPAKAVANLVFTLKAAQTISDVVPGGKATFSSSSVTVVESPAINSPVSKGFSLTLNGPAPPPSRRSRASSRTSRPATRGQRPRHLQDAANHSYLAHSSSSGKFSFTAGGSTPVVAGPVVIGASKDGYQDLPGRRSLQPRPEPHRLAGAHQGGGGPTVGVGVSDSSASASSGLPSPTDGRRGAERLRRCRAAGQHHRCREQQRYERPGRSSWSSAACCCRGRCRGDLSAGAPQAR